MIVAATASAEQFGFDLVKQQVRFIIKLAQTRSPIPNQEPPLTLRSALAPCPPDAIRRRWQPRLREVGNRRAPLRRSHRPLFSARDRRRGVDSRQSVHRVPLCGHVPIFLGAGARHTSSPVLHFHLSCTALAMARSWTPSSVRGRRRRSRCLDAWSWYAAAVDTLYTPMAISECGRGDHRNN